MSEPKNIHIRSHIMEYTDKATGEVVAYGFSIQIDDEPMRKYGPFKNKEDATAKADEFMALLRRRLGEAGLPTRKAGIA